MKTIFIAALSFMLCSCMDDPAEKYIGTWSNTYVGNGADIEIVVSKDGGNLFVVQQWASSHALYKRASAKVVDGYLVISPGFGFTKATYSSQNDELVPLEGPLSNVPAYRKVH